jgi:CRP/FNR family transcriptional regulator, cyclic AMP receptor protein
MPALAVRASTPALDTKLAFANMTRRGGSRPRRGPLDEDARAAIQRSHLRALSSEVIAGLTADASRLRVPAGSVIHREGDTAASLEVVVSGLVRVYVTARDGRTMTVRYCRPGALLGVVTLFASPFSLPATVQAVTETDLLAFRPSVVKRAAERDARVAGALIDELSERVLSFIAEIPGSAFATVRQRVARHLLDLASERQSDSQLTAAIGQQELADAVGSVREVVVRALREFRQEGLIETRRKAIVLLDPEALLEQADPRDAGTTFSSSGTKVPDSRARAGETLHRMSENTTSSRRDRRGSRRSERR